MAERKAYLLRLPPDLLEELTRWAADELRSVNAQIEYVLREGLRKRAGGRDAVHGGGVGGTEKNEERRTKNEE